MALDDLDGREAESQAPENVAAELGRLRRNLDQIPDQAGSSPAVNVTDSHDKTVVGPSQRDHRIPFRSYQLVGLRRGVHYLEAIQAGCDQLSQVVPVVAPIFRQRCDRERAHRRVTDRKQPKESRQTVSVLATADRERVAE